MPRGCPRPSSERGPAAPPAARGVGVGRARTPRARAGSARAHPKKKKGELPPRHRVHFDVLSPPYQLLTLVFKHKGVWGENAPIGSAPLAPEESPFDLPADHASRLLYHIHAVIKSAIAYTQRCLSRSGDATIQTGRTRRPTLQAVLLPLDSARRSGPASALIVHANAGMASRPLGLPRLLDGENHNAQQRVEVRAVVRVLRQARLDGAAHRRGCLGWQQWHEMRSGEVVL